MIHEVIQPQSLSCITLADGIADHLLTHSGKLKLRDKILGRFFFTRYLHNVGKIRGKFEN
jgi:hypothetical protein